MFPNFQLNKVFIKPLFILIAAQLLFLIYALCTNHHFTKDSTEYLAQAGNLLRHGTLYCGDYNVPVKDPGLYSRRPPGYGVFILFFSIFLHFNLLILIVQCLLSIFNIYIGYKILSLIFRKQPETWLYFSMFLLFPTQFIYAATFMAEIPFQTMLLLSILFLLRFEQNGALKNLYLCHLFTALTYLFKPITLFLWIGFILYSITIKSDSRASQHLTILAVGHFFLLSLFFLNNYSLTGIAEYTSVGRKVIFNYNLPHVLTRAYGEEQAKHKIDSVQNAMRGMPYVMQCVYTDNFIRHTLLTRPVDFIVSHAGGIPRFFLETGRWDLELWYNGNDQAEQLPSLKTSYEKEGFRGLLHLVKEWPVMYTGYYLLVIAGTFGIFLLFIKGLFSKLIQQRHRSLLLFTIFYFVILTGPSASSRFRLPVFPLIAIVALAGWSSKKKESPSEPEETMLR